MASQEQTAAEAAPDKKAEKSGNGRKEFFRTIKYFLVAASAGGIQMGTFALFLEVFHWTHWVAYLISLVLSVLWNFTLNRKFTFKAANNVPVAMFKVACYYAVFTPLSTWWTREFNAMASPENARAIAYGVEAATLLTNGITEFLYQRFFVFGKSLDSAAKG